MSAIKDGRYEVELNGKKYHLLFSLNVLDELQDRFGGYDKLDNVFDKNNKNMIKDLKWLLTALINEGADENEPQLTEQQVGKIIHIGSLKTIKDAIFAAFSTAVRGDEDDVEDEEQEAEENTGETKAVQES
jgi:hypothetical protein